MTSRVSFDRNVFEKGQPAHNNALKRSGFDDDFYYAERMIQQMKRVVKKEKKT